jgi:hypothetical protein
MTLLLKSLFLDLDLVGVKVDLLHKKSKIVKSYPGSILTLTIIIFFIYSTVYFGSDIIYKEKPISRFSKTYNNATRILLKDYTIKIGVTDFYGRTLDVSKYISFRGTYNWLSLDGQPFYVTQDVIIEQCRDEFFPAEIVPLQHMGGMSYFNSSLCINPFKYIAPNGTIVNEEVFIQNPLGMQNSSFVTIYVEPCTNTSLNNNSCLPLDQQTKLANSVQYTTSFVDSYINLNDFTKPSNYFLSTLTLAISTNIKKTHYLAIRKAVIETDSGIIMEDLSTNSTLQVSNIRTDISNENFFYHFVISGDNLMDNYSRRYIKIQDIIANIGGLLKFLLSIASFLLSFFVNLGLRLDVLNTLYDLKSSNETLPPVDIKLGSVKGDSINMSNIHIKKDNYMSPSNIVVHQIKASVGDYLRSTLHCRSKYKSKLYRQFEELTYYKFEILNVIKDSIRLENIVTLLCSEEQKQAIDQKRIVVPENLKTEFNHQIQNSPQELKTNLIIS